MNGKKSFIRKISKIFRKETWKKNFFFLNGISILANVKCDIRIKRKTLKTTNNVANVHNIEDSPISEYTLLHYS